MGNALDELLAGFGKRPESKHTRDCAAIGCVQRVFGYVIFCPPCYAKIPSDIRRVIEKHHRPGKPPSKQLTRFVAKALDELLYLKINGKCRPVQPVFEWDDEPATSPASSCLLFEGKGDEPKS